MNQFGQGILLNENKKGKKSYVTNDEFKSDITMLNKLTNNNPEKESESSWDQEQD